MEQDCELVLRFGGDEIVQEDLAGPCNVPQTRGTCNYEIKLAADKIGAVVSDAIGAQLEANYDIPNRVKTVPIE